LYAVGRRPTVLPLFRGPPLAATTLPVFLMATLAGFLWTTDAAAFVPDPTAPEVRSSVGATSPFLSATDGEFLRSLPVGVT